MDSNVNVPSIYVDLIELAVYFKSQFGEPKHVFYPGCGEDATPAVAFMRSRVMFLDQEQAMLDRIKLVMHHVGTCCSLAENYANSDGFDLVIDSHSQVGLEQATKNLRPGGHVITRNKGADKYFDSDLFELVAAYDRLQNPVGCTSRFETTCLAKYIEAYPKGHDDALFGSRRKIKMRMYVFRKR